MNVLRGGYDDDIAKGSRRIVPDLDCGDPAPSAYRGLLQPRGCIDPNSDVGRTRRGVAFGVMMALVAIFGSSEIACSGKRENIQGEQENTFEVKSAKNYDTSRWEIEESEKRFFTVVFERKGYPEDTRISIVRQRVSPASINEVFFINVEYADSEGVKRHERFSVPSFYADRAGDAFERAASVPYFSDLLGDE